VKRARFPRAALCSAVLAAALPSAADEIPPEETPEPPPSVRMLEGPPRYGSYYQRWEPTFYTGFAPRADDPRRIHLHLGRGNQLRITVVLSEATIAAYARDLKARRDTYLRLVADGRMVLTQNRGIDAFTAALEEVDLDALVASERDLAPAALRERNLALMERLNPKRVFRIAIPEGALIRRWVLGLRPEDRKAMDRDRRLEVLNALLPTRLWVAELDSETRTALDALVAAAPSAASLESGVPAAFADAYFALLGRVAPGLYPRQGGRVAFAEFTAIQPVGTFNETTNYRGRKIPLYPTPGRRALTTHQRTRTVDHIPTVAAYSYSPWLPYMHVGTTMHNSFHTLWWRMPVEETPFLPQSWREAASDGPGGEPNTYLWLLSRGPMSHGCTHLTTGHISELRQLLPAETAALYEVDVYLNRSYDYDVFDIDGDLEPEVMGVGYFIAYSLSNKRPHRLRVANERSAYYDWLYAGDLALGGNGDGQGVFHDIQDGRFIGRTARSGRHYARVPLYEAAYEPERFQFYRLVDIPFARALRQVGADRPFPDGKGNHGSQSPGS
jgi:hypothetical protein